MIYILSDCFEYYLTSEKWQIKMNKKFMIKRHLKSNQGIGGKLSLNHPIAHKSWFV